MKDMKIRKFKAHGNNYIISSGKYLYGVQGVAVVENSYFKGFYEMVTINDFDKVEKIIKDNKDFDKNYELWI
ncbi:MULTISPECIES: hypothetical protein [Mammaliicoccus]|uniref:hypothetical protein n=1 Tax=Mammaliicoccus TaxID=2803850 RepID=UPI001EFCADC1|nr:MULTISPECIES: hypothetical protein [Mammaliicoccus]MCE5086331.1 hypothetical protein [Mammaliicoccus sciuri]